ncbi:MAG: CDP-alcohol phosphatidyltransferase family protein [Nitrospinae bacterium]|nr:CDP-alcohol phosphatidyltransferase family protein [Nitrospinota bacterium]
MNNNDHSTSRSDFQSHTAVLYLPAPLDLAAYSKKIAGVPFLLRNLLTLQKLGVERLNIWADEPRADDLNRFLEKLKQDPRLELDWFSEKPLSSDTTSFLVFDGAILIDECTTKIAQKSEDNLLSLPQSLKHFLSQKKVYGLQSATSVPLKRLQNENDFQEAENRLLKSCGLNNDSFMDRLLTRFISRQFTNFFLKTSFTPNQITCLSLLIGLIAAFCFYLGSYQAGIVGSVLLLVSCWVDCVDGEVARLKFMVSEWGAKLDILADNIVHCLVFFSIGMGLFFKTSEPVYIYLGMLAVLGSFWSFILLSKTIIGKKANATQKNSEESEDKNFTDQLANRDFTYFLFVLAIFGRLDAFIILTAIGSNLLAIYLACQKFKSQPA